jgi:23S rRNA (guanine745-N1)-methyltransferase
VTSALDRALPLLRCPVCRTALARADQTLRCRFGHAFDVARQGYVSLFAGARPHPGDTAEMIGARERFLSSGHYATIASGVVEAVSSSAPPGPVLDLAAGTGWYAAQVLDAAPERVGVAVDVSTPALKRAARAHERVAAIGADAWGVLPVRDAAFAAVLSVFGPRDAAEIGRVLTPRGAAVVVTPTPAHLAELVGPLGMLGVGDGKPALLREAFDAFEFVGAQRVQYAVELDHPGLADLAGMGPTGHHVGVVALAERVATLPDTVEVTVSVDVTTFRRLG